uniref:CCHC-type domain-containing protein n=1 Tax=Tanacetum cinerariifolium TaxID=118510 RepID=A0A6L2P6C2_TANCI|nr:hypothetical protein [Tanacetum cinerariifolium]
MFIDCTTKVDSEPLNGINDDITNPYECDQTLNVSAGTLNLSEVQASLFNDKMASADNTSGPASQRKESCTLQCVLSLKEEKSSYLRAVLSTTSISSHACSVNNSGLVPQPPSPTPNVPPIKNDWDTLFCPIFDEYFNPSPSVTQPVFVAVVQEHVVSTSTPSSTRTDQDTPSTTTDTAEEVMDRERETKAMTTLLMALPEDHFAKFHKMADAKEMWEAIKSRFGYDRFQTLLSQLKIHGSGVSHEDVNQKFLRSLPSSWSQVSLIRRTKPGLDTLSFDDLYNNLRVFKRDVKGTTASSSSSSNTKNVAFVAPQLDCDDLEKINDDDLEEIDLKWQVAMISIRIKKFYKRTRRKLQFDTKDPVSFDKTKVECFNCHKIGHFARDCRAKGNQDSRRRNGGYNGNKARDNSRVN